MNFDKELDARGMSCPLPILKTKKSLNDLTSGQVLKVVATDPGSVKDMQAFANQTGNELLVLLRREQDVRLLHEEEVDPRSAAVPIRPTQRSFSMDTQTSNIVGDEKALDRMIRERVDALLDQKARGEARGAQGGEDAVDDDHRHQGHARLGVSAVHPVVDRRGAGLGRLDLLHVLRARAAQEGPVGTAGEPARQSGDADEDAVRTGLVQVDPLEHSRMPCSR